VLNPFLLESDSYKKNPENPVDPCPKNDHKYGITQTIFAKNGNDYEHPGYGVRSTGPEDAT